MPALDPDVRDFLATPGRYATLATIDDDGSPLQAVVWYVLEDDDTILINSLQGRRWPANLRRDPRASLTVEEGYDYVSLRGTAELIAEGETASRDIERLARRYASDEAAAERSVAQFQGQRRVSFRFRARTAFRHR